VSPGPPAARRGRGAVPQHCSWSCLHHASIAPRHPTTRHHRTQITISTRSLLGEDKAVLSPPPLATYPITHLDTLSLTAPPSLRPARAHNSQGSSTLSTWTASPYTVADFSLPLERACVAHARLATLPGKTRAALPPTSRNTHRHTVLARTHADCCPCCSHYLCTPTHAPLLLPTHICPPCQSTTATQSSPWTAC